LIYLRARYYNPADGRFQSRDTWSGNANLPMSLNRWNYTQSNPINYSDPTGHISESEGIKADNISVRLASKGVIIYKDWGDIKYVAPHAMGITGCGWNIGRWDINDLINIDEAMKDLEKALKGSGKIRAAVGQVIINKKFLNGHMMSPPGVLDHVLSADILVQATASSSNDAWFKYTIVHEFGHVWDYRVGKRFSSELMKLTGGWVCYRDRYGMEHCYFDPSTIIEDAPDTLIRCQNPTTVDSVCQEKLYSYKNTGAGEGTENWAQTFAYYVYPNYQSSTTIGLKSIRRQYVKKQIANLP